MNNRRAIIKEHLLSFPRDILVNAAWQEQGRNAFALLVKPELHLAGGADASPLSALAQANTLIAALQSEQCGCPVASAACPVPPELSWQDDHLLSASKLHHEGDSHGRAMTDKPGLQVCLHLPA